MPTSEKLCLRWDDFKENINTAFLSLSKDTNFTDATLVGEDSHQVEAHKGILASSSPFFLNILARNRHGHPLIYMRGMKLDDLVAIMDFLYYGEANVYHDNLDTFLTIAEELQLKGLNGENEDGRGRDESPSEQTVQSKSMINAPHIKNSTTGTMTSAQIDPLHSESDNNDQISRTMGVALSKHEFSGNMQELDEQIETMMGPGDKR